MWILLNITSVFFIFQDLERIIELKRVQSASTFNMKSGVVKLIDFTKWSENDKFLS